MDVVPDGPAQHTGVHILVRCHGVVGQIVSHLELLIQHLTDIRIQSVDQREAMILPAVILEKETQLVSNSHDNHGLSLCIQTELDFHLHSECGHMLPPPGEVLVAVAGVLKVSRDISGWHTLLILRGDHQHALRLLPLEASCHLLLAGLLVITALLQLLHALHQHLHLTTHLLQRHRSTSVVRMGSHARRTNPSLGEFEPFSLNDLREKLLPKFNFYTAYFSLSAHTPSFTTHLVAKHIVMVISMTVAISNVTHTILAKRWGSERVSTVAVDLRRDAAAKCERGEGVVVCEEDHRVD